MPNPPMTDDELREQLSTLKPHTDSQMPLGSLLSVKELDAILSLIHQREAALLERIVAPYYAEDLHTYDYDGIAQSVLDTIKKDVGGKQDE